MKYILIVALASILAHAAFAQSARKTNAPERIQKVQKEMAEQTEQMNKQLRESYIKVQTDLQLGMRANQLAKDEAEKKFNCIIYEKFVKHPKSFSWSAGTGKSVIFDSDELGGYVKIDAKGNVSAIGDFRSFPELVYRDDVTAAMKQKVKNDPAEVKAAQEKAAAEFDKMQNDIRMRTKAKK